MSGLAGSDYALGGERSSALLAPALAVLGVVLGTVDMLWLARHNSPPASEPAAVVRVPAVVTVTKLPEPEAPAPVVPPVAAPPRETEPRAVKPDDCAPLFPVTFALGGVTPMYDSEALTTLVEWMASHGQANLVVDGHSDSLGTAATNLALSHRRASEMVKRFIRAGLSSTRITRRAFGNYTPVVGTREDSPKNRRVVLSVAGTRDCAELESK